MFSSKPSFIFEQKFIKNHLPKNEIVNEIQILDFRKYKKKQDFLFMGKRWFTHKQISQ